MLKNSKPVAAFCSVALVSGVASNLVSAQKVAVSKKENSSFVQRVYDKVRNAVLRHKTVAALVAGSVVVITAGAWVCAICAKNTRRIANIVLLGPPGSGKGTHFETIANKFGLVHYSTGDMLREEVAKGTEDGKIANSYMKEGKLVPSNIVEKLTRNNLLNSKTGHVIDGSPRSVDEAKFLDSIGLDITKVLYLDVSDDEIVKRVSGRRVCSCGASYHMLYNKPKKDGICDKCGGKLTQRADDQMYVVKERLKVFHEQTEPVLDYYEKQGKLVKINGMGSIDEVKQNLLEILDKDESLKKLSKKPWYSSIF